MFSVEALSDGGVVICGNKHRYNTEGKRDSSRAFMLKIAGDGSILSNNEMEDTGWDITVFPNPSQGIFTVNIAGNTEETKLNIYDLQGRKIFSVNKLLSGTNSYDLSRYNQGIYIWKLEKEGRIIDKGKWIMNY